MRRILVDHARSREYRKRGGDAQRVTLNDGLVASPEPTVDVVASNTVKRDWRLAKLWLLRELKGGDEE